MCGIVGYCDQIEGVVQKREQLEMALKTLAHRGPDGLGSHFWEQVFLGHTRLSIIDLSKGANQPFHFFEERVAIVFNGEIYNYRELSKELPALRTASDTEVILRGYVLYGTRFFKRLRGMFAFAIYDYRSVDSVILYRDLAGVKPLYYVNQKNKFAFASEIKALRGLFSLTPNEATLKTYFALGYCPEPSTAYREISACRPGECIVFDVQAGSIQKEILDDYDFEFVNQNASSENLEITRGLLHQAVKRNLVADVPLAVSLSGGIDSSLVAASSGRAHLNLLTVKFQEAAYDESAVAQKFANELNQQVEVIDIKDQADIDLLDRILLHFDQPFSDTSIIPFYFLSKAASKRGKVLLGGDGGDEIHSGYSSFGWLPMLWSYRKFFRAINPIGQCFLGGAYLRTWNRMQGLATLPKACDAICEWSSWLPPTTTFQRRSVFLFDTNEIFEGFQQYWMPNEAPFSAQLSFGYFRKRMLSDYLRKADMMSMINGLEYRVPLLDEDLVRFGLSIPSAQRADLFTQKKVLRKIHQATYTGHEYRRPKTGFSIPVDRWLSHEHFELIKAKLTAREAEVAQFVRPEYIKFLFDALTGKYAQTISRASVYQRIIQLYSFQLFCERC